MMTRADVRRVIGAGVGIWLLALSATSYVRAQVWQGELALWTDAVAKSPQKPRPWINLGLAREQAGDLIGAFQAQQTAFSLAFQPRLTTYQQVFSQVAAQTNLARMLAQHDQEGAALQLLDQVVARVPYFAHARWNRAVLLAKTGHCAQGAADAAIAHQLDAAFGALVCP